MNRAEYIEHLRGLAKQSRAGLAEFTRRANPTCAEIIGLTVPTLRKEAAEIIKGVKRSVNGSAASEKRSVNGSAASEEHNTNAPTNAPADAWRVYLKILTDRTWEEQMIRALIIAKAEMNPAERCGLVREFVPQIRDWAVNDILASECRFLSKERYKYFDFVLSLNNGGEYDGRIVLTMLNSHYVTAEYIGRVLKTAEQINQDYYYTKMAAAWLVSTCYIKFPQETEEFLRRNTLPVWTHNKAIRKSCESYRVPAESKARLKKLLR